jgi:hypothetical protein
MTTNMLEKIVEESSTRSTFDAEKAMVKHLKDQYGSTIQTILFYGSCMRLGTDRNLVLDFYVLVDSLPVALGNKTSATFAGLLPPNVYYHECQFNSRVIRAKVAVMSFERFLYSTSKKTFSSAIWARFSQPCIISYAKNQNVKLRTIKALKDAIITLLSNCAHLVVNAKTVKQAWVLAYTATYKAELRPESKDRPKELVEAQLEYFERAGTAAMNELGLNINHSEIISSKAAWTWRLRSVWGKTLNLLRLIKAAFTYKGGINYIKWKLQRHWKAKT